MGEGGDEDSDCILTRAIMEDGADDPGRELAHREQDDNEHHGEHGTGERDHRGVDAAEGGIRPAGEPNRDERTGIDRRCREGDEDADQDAKD